MYQPPKMRVFTGKEVRTVEVDDPWERSLLGSYWNAVKQYLDTGSEPVLWDFEGKTVAGLPLQTNPDQIEAAARRGEVEFEDIYLSSE
jgi:hypothetical protein